MKVLMQKGNSSTKRLTEENGYVHEGASHRFVMRGLENGEVGSDSGCQIVDYFTKQPTV